MPFALWPWIAGSLSMSAGGIINAIVNAQSAKKSRDMQEKLEENRLAIQQAGQEGNSQLQRELFEKQRNLQLELLLGNRETQLTVIQEQRETARQQPWYQKRVDNWPLRLVPEDIISAHPNRQPVPLQIILAPPEIDYDRFGNGADFPKLEKRMAQKMRSLFERYFPLESNDRPVELLDRAWDSNRFGGGSSIKTLFNQLRSESVLVLESETSGERINLRVAYWSGGAETYNYKTVITDLPYLDILDGFARQRVLKWKTEVYDKLITQGKTEEELSKRYPQQMAGLKVWRSEQEDLAAEIPFDRHYPYVTEDDVRFGELFTSLHSLMVGAFADLHYLILENREPQLPAMLPEILPGFADAEVIRKMLEWVVAAYEQAFSVLESDRDAWLADLRLALAEGLTHLEDKTWVHQQLGRSMTLWLQQRGGLASESFSQLCGNVETVATMNDVPYLQRVNRVLQKLGEPRQLMSAEEAEKRRRKADAKNSSRLAGRFIPYNGIIRRQTMSNNPLQNLKLLFQNRPEVLRMLDARELDLAGLESEAYIREQKKRKLYPEPVNFYATGRTGAGKTSLGNTLLDTGTGKPPMESHGHQDCTSSVQFFQLTSNLRYFDLPGAGSDEKFENINRAALLIEQITDEDEGIEPVSKFHVLDFSEYETKGVQTEDIPVPNWQSSENQKLVSADVILYVVAPHMLFIGDDKRYLRALLKSQTQRKQNQKIIFALNIHRTEDRQLKPTPQNLQDARKIITEVYQKFYPNTDPTIVEIDSLTGTGISQITELICKILPAEKIGNMQQVLKKELKDFAKKERSYRYRKTLIYIASRLATERVDTPLGAGILNEAYAAVCDYGISIFFEEDARAEMENELYQLVDEVAAKTKTSRAKAIETVVDVVEYKEEKEEQIVGWDQEYEDVEVPDVEIDYREKTQSRVETVETGRSPGRIAVGVGVGGLAGAGATLLGLAGAAAAGVATGGVALLPILGAVMAGGAAAGGAVGAKKQTKQVTVNEDVIEPVVKKVTKMEKRLAGMKARKEEVTKQIPYTVQKSKKVGEEFIQGGYPVVENLLAIGLGIEGANSSTDLAGHFADIVKSGQQQVQATLSRYRNQINQLAESTPPDIAEAQIIKILESALLK
ncbi:hypothetical protein [[Phormidium] sp. ETS-05]|uniref:hypothetical protein n=1 Tax=[Phormidium] sp. ETS-05 TaxID=222819 RepID=UPI0018EEFCEE|nr:hypothetical protein [[Phormidium] sp. ETS-05]